MVLSGLVLEHEVPLIIRIVTRETFAKLGLGLISVNLALIMHIESQSSA